MTDKASLFRSVLSEKEKVLCGMPGLTCCPRQARLSVSAIDTMEVTKKDDLLSVDRRTFPLCPLRASEL